MSYGVIIKHRISFDVSCVYLFILYIVLYFTTIKWSLLMNFKRIQTFKDRYYIFHGDKKFNWKYLIIVHLLLKMLGTKNGFWFLTCNISLGYTLFENLPRQIYLSMFILNVKCKNILKSVHTYYFSYSTTCFSR